MNKSKVPARFSSRSATIKSKNGSDEGSSAGAGAGAGVGAAGVVA